MSKTELDRTVSVKIIDNVLKETNRYTCQVCLLSIRNKHHSRPKNINTSSFAVDIKVWLSYTYFQIKFFLSIHWGDKYKLCFLNILNSVFLQN